MTEPEFYVGLNELLKKTSLSDLKVYLRWHLLHSAGPALGKAIVDEDFRFRSTALTGEKQLLPKWKRCVETADHLLDDATKAAAKDKLSRIFNKIGYPDHWRNYDGLTIDRGSYLANRMRAATFESKRDLAKIGKPLDRSEWLMSPPAVNAYYHASLNEIVFPAGILQPPFFNRAAGKPVNYGAIGMVMGHELTHGFDDQGRQFDGQGNLREWWTKEVGEAFNQRAACVAKQYDGYLVLGEPVNGKLTLGENIADIGGIQQFW